MRRFPHGATSWSGPARPGAASWAHAPSRGPIRLAPRAPSRARTAPPTLDAPEPPRASAAVYSDELWIAVVSSLLPPPAPCDAMSLVMSPCTFTLPAMNACMPAAWLPETKTSFAVA